MNGVEQARSRVAEALERAAAAHEAGRLPELHALFESVDVAEVRIAGEDGDRIAVALRFIDGWVDASQHDWHYYPGIGREDWPGYARPMAIALREGRALDLPDALERFATRDYSATFASMAGLVAVAAVFFAAGTGVGLLAPSGLVAALSMLPLARVVLARLRLRVTLSPISIAQRGLFRTRRVRIADVRWAGWAATHGWGASRWWGPFVYELRTPNERLRVNLKLFPLECAADVMRVVPPSN